MHDSFVVTIEACLVTPALPALVTQLAQIGGIGKALGTLSFGVEASTVWKRLAVKALKLRTTSELNS